MIARGKEYTLSFSDFTVNTIDPENVGIFMMGAVLRTDSRDSDMELALRSWFGSIEVDARAGGPPGVFVGDGGGQSHDRAAQIISALNSQDAAALRGMFTEHALAEYSAEIDEGLRYLLSMFPEGQIVEVGQGGSAVRERVDGDLSTVMLLTFYTVLGWSGLSVVLRRLHREHDRPRQCRHLCDRRCPHRRVSD